MATEETERLVVELEARISQFERNFARANRTANARFGAIEARGKQAANRLSQSFSVSTAGINTALGRLGVGSLLGGAGILAGLAKVKDAAADLAKIGDTADAVGLTTERLQELRFASEQAAGSVEAVDTGFKRFAQNVAEAKAGGGELLKVLQANNIELRDSGGNLRSTNALFLDFANLIRGAKSPADQLRLAVMAFGRSAGPELVGLLKGGSAEIERLAAQARATGAVIDDRLIRKGQELDDRFAAVSTTVSTKLKAAIVEVADAVKDFLDLLDRVRGGEVPLEKIGQRSIAITRELVGWEKQLEDARNTAAHTGLQVDRDRVRVIERRIAALQAEDRALIARGQAEAERRMKPPEPAPKPTVIPAAQDAKNPFDTEQARLAKRIELLAAETQTLGMNTAERERARASVELMHAAQQAGIPINEELRSKVDALSRQWGDAAARAEQARNRFDAVQDAAREFGGAVTQAFSGMVFEGQKFNDVLANMLKRLANRAFEKFIESLLFGPNSGGGLVSGSGLLGGFASLLGAFGGQRADGGPVSPGKAFLVGERGPEIIVPKAPGTVIPNHAIGGQSFAQSNVINVTVNGSSGTVAQNDDLAARVGKEVQAAVRRLTAAELRTQMKPGGLLYGRR